MPLLTQEARGYHRKDSTVPLELTQLWVIIQPLTGSATVRVHFGSFIAARSGHSKIPSAIQSFRLRRARIRL